MSVSDIMSNLSDCICNLLGVEIDQHEVERMKRRRIWDSIVVCEPIETIMMYVKSRMSDVDVLVESAQTYIGAAAQAQLDTAQKVINVTNEILEKDKALAAEYMTADLLKRYRIAQSAIDTRQAKIYELQAKNAPKPVTGKKSRTGGLFSDS